MTKPATISYDSLSSEDLVQRIQKHNDKEAMNVLVRKNSALFHSVAKKYALIKKGNSEDLYQIGVIGLIKAANNFNLEYGTQFSTYAVHLIRGEIRKFFRDDGIIKVSRTLRSIYIKAKEARDEYIAKQGTEPSVSEISLIIGESYEDVLNAFEACRNPDYLYDYVDSSSDNSHVKQDVVKVEDKGLEATIDMIDLKNALSNLSKENRQLIVLRYFKNMTQTNVAKIMGISQVQVSRLEHKIIQNLKNNLK